MMYAVKKKDNALEVDKKTVDDTGVMIKAKERVLDCQ